MSDLPKLLGLCADAANDHRAFLEEQAIENAADHLKFANTAAAITFGTEAANTLTGWAYTDNAPDDTLQMFAPLADGVYLRYTAPMDGAHWFEVVANCDSCGHAKETRVGSLTGLGKALAAAGVRL